MHIIHSLTLYQRHKDLQRNNWPHNRFTASSGRPESIVACKWQLRFNADKCESMPRITHSQDKSVTNYTSGKTLKDVNCFKDLGVEITKDLCWGNHINMFANKSNKVLGVIKCSVGTANVNLFSMLYKSLVRPILEYAAPVWSPYLAFYLNVYRE